AVAFDGLAIFDTRPIAALVETLFPERGHELGVAWRARQFEYQWLRALAGRYANFMQVTEEALLFAAASLHLQVSPEARDQLLQAHLALRAWPDATESLRALREAGMRLAFLSNMTGRMLQAGIETAGLEGLFEEILSTDAIGTYKPDPRAYRMATDALRLERDEVLFVASAGWDAAGAKWFGYPTYWVNRLDLPEEAFGASADGMGRDLRALADFALPDRPAADRGAQERVRSRR
ncbi:MAG TPA: haloacid dehalogenase type II, partial [Candidatus Polarisedimenticolia bacterium]|nr:haloacid dehalogenase type II [Candidatus Polarisedimenticolia bacterium]